MYKIAKFTLLVLLWVQLVSAEEASDPADGNGNLKTISRLLNDCGRQDDVTICFKMKAVSFLDRLVRAKADIPITDFMSLGRDNSAPPPEDNETRETPATEQELYATLPRSLEEKSQKLDDLLWSKFSTLLRTRKINFNVPSEIFEGRGDKGGKIGKKGGGIMMMGAMMAGMMMKMAMGGIAMMAGKALMVGKIALVLSIIIGLKKLTSGGGGGGESHPQVVYATAEHSSHGGGGGGGGGYHRRYMDAQNLAYGSLNPDF